MADPSGNQVGTNGRNFSLRVDLGSSIVRACCGNLPFEPHAAPGTGILSAQLYIRSSQDRPFRLSGSGTGNDSSKYAVMTIMMGSKPATLGVPRGWQCRSLLWMLHAKY